MRSTLKLAAALSALMAGTAAEAATVDLVPHRAVYDLRLAESGAAMTDTPASMSGRMVYEFTGSACEGFTVNFRFVIEMTDTDGQTSVTDLRTSNFEGGSAESFQFVSQTYSNQVLTEDVKGSADRSARTVAVTLDKPESRTLSFSGDVSFPTEHLRRIISAAIEGQTLLELDVYDGSDGGSKVYKTTTIVGHEKSDRPDGTDAQVGDVRRWPVTVSYFDTTAAGDLTPDYSIAFDLWENGVSTDMRMDYGDFALDATMAQYEPLPITACR